jgi:hypothetical protein
MLFLIKLRFQLYLIIYENFFNQFKNIHIYIKNLDLNSNIMEKVKATFNVNGTI